MKSYAKALELIKNISAAHSKAETPVEDSIGLTLSSDIRAQIPSPPFTNSAMDGYAIMGEALENDIYAVIGQVYAGQEANEFSAQTASRGAIKITTGSVVPPPFDTIIPIELTSEVDTCHIRINQNVQRGSHIRKIGSDLAAGSSILFKGQSLTPERALLAKATGNHILPVTRRPSLGLFYTGDEIRNDTQPLSGCSIYNSSRIFLEGHLNRLGWQPTISTHLKDDPTLAISKVAAFLEKEHNKLIISTGAVSKGDKDFIPDIANKLGFDTIFHGVSIKPGKPIFLSQKNETLWLGLPGNPISTLVGWYFFVLPLIHEIAFIGKPEKLSVTLSEGVKKPKNLRCFYRGLIEGNIATALGSQKSADLASLREANALLELPEGTDFVEKNTTITAIRMH